MPPRKGRPFFDQPPKEPTENTYQEAPRWAKDLVHSALEWWEEQNPAGKYIPEPELSWVIGEYRLGTEGRSYLTANTIAIIEGPHLNETKYVLLHELGHILSEDPSHSDSFWDVAVKLCRWAGFSDSDMFRLEERRFREDLESALERLEE